MNYFESPKFKFIGIHQRALYGHYNGHCNGHCTGTVRALCRHCAGIVQAPWGVVARTVADPVVSAVDELD